jgi:ADP-heptose:LPS heptosyltransferase
LGSTSSPARRVLECLLAGEPWPRAWLVELKDDPALFSVVAEGLSDRFEPRLVDAYTDIFCEVFGRAGLRERYERVRRPRRCEGDAGVVYVLSRVTLGADIAVTSVLLDAAKRRFPRARIVFAGPRKNWDLFSADPRIEHLPVAYARAATLGERVAACPWIEEPASIVIDPDSRITQLGLLPVCPEENYYFFESRGYGAESEDSLVALARRWAAETFGITDARAYIAPAEKPDVAEGGIAVSLGVGENPAKRVPDPFEQRLVASLAARGLPVILDAGAGGEEGERAARAAACATGLTLWRGSFAGFASIIARSRLYVGYDSAGQHAAAAAGTPLVTVFSGAPCPRFLHRWRPAGTLVVTQ